MPLPTPNKGEEQSSFVSRCVSAISDKGEFGSTEQRVAVCHSQWKKSKAEETLANMMVGRCPECGEKMEDGHECDDEEE